jgi:tetratricopeptide (TPR) repeat protein
MGKLDRIPYWKNSVAHLKDKSFFEQYTSTSEIINDAFLYDHLGDLYTATNNHVAALAYYQRAYELADNDYGVSISHDLSQCLRRLGKYKDSLGPNQIGFENQWRRYCSLG